MAGDPLGSGTRFGPPLIGDIAPAFACRSTRGDLDSASFLGRWLVFFSHPADFTPVCTSEFVAFAKAAPEFAAIGCDLLALSVDSLFSHIAWVRTIERRFGVAIPFPVVEDPSMAIAAAYGMIHPGASSSSTVRGCFVIDPEGVVRMSCWYPMSTGRSVAEILRTVVALQTADAEGVLTPEAWVPGEPVIDLADFTADDDRDVSDWFYQTRMLEAAE
ncbi:peroxiredoxin [Aureimonas glaciei]|uniref:Thioredoxin peroxidase n=1 Tax=Aureimonas glaciei TaxID=1776957 RepID=A0A916XVU2_9HYPH|nr:peroxiredoxin [Aureimonas glaciei]GGD15533.1 peroxiredoxin [Aureimonas glaciei]